MANQIYVRDYFKTRKYSKIVILIACSIGIILLHKMTLDVLEINKSAHSLTNAQLESFQFNDAYNLAIKKLSLSSIPLEKIKRTLILSQSRSGSTFLEDLLQQAWPSFGLFEPIRKVVSTKKLDKRNKNVNHDHQLVKLKYLAQLFECDVMPYFENEVQFAHRVNSHLIINEILNAIHGDYRKNYYQLVNFTNDICLMSGQIAAKELTVPVSHLNQLMRLMSPTLVNPRNPLHVLVLFRDPRAIISSRIERIKSTHPNVTDIFKLQPQRYNSIDARFTCNQFLETINQLKAIYSDNDQTVGTSFKINLVRYEDLASQPIEFAKRLFSYLSLDFTDKVEEWIIEHTQDDKKNQNMFSTFREAQARIVRWSSKLDSNVRRNIERECDQVMNLLGYKTLSTQTNSHLNQPVVPQFNDLVNQEYPLKQYSIP